MNFACDFLQALAQLTDRLATKTAILQSDLRALIKRKFSTLHEYFETIIT